MDVEAVVSVVIQKLTDLLIQESIIFNKATDEVELIRISLRQMQNFLRDAEDKKERDDDVKKWVKEFLAVVYKVEDAIETFVLWRMHIRRIGFSRRHFFIHKKLKAGTDLRNEMKEVKKKIKELDDKWKQSVQKSHHGDPPSPRNEESSNVGPSSYQAEGLTQNQQASSSYSVDEESGIIGFKEVERKLMSRLTDTFDRRRDVISIVGAVGSGKTTLARGIYNSSKIKGHFDCRAWVSASGNLTDVLRSILEQTGNSTVDKESNHREELVKKLRENLKKKRYLVALDDVRRLDVLKDLRDALPKETNCSRVLLTTSNDDVATLANPMRSPYQLKPLEDEDAWNLFLKKVRFQLPDDFQFSDSNILKNAHQKTLAISELKRKVITSCKGLPLAIVVLGGFLSTKSASFQEWSKVLDHPSWQLEGNEVQVSKILALSYNDLPFYLRLCLLYFGRFPKGYEISMRKIQRSWLKEGFVKQSPERAPEAEDMVERYLGELLNREMIQITTRRKDGSDERYCLRGELYDIILPKVKDTGLFDIHGNALDLGTDALSGYQDKGPTQNQQNNPSSVDDESDVIGFRDHNRRLMNRLTHTSYRHNLDVISIVGEVGSGKTTLARGIYNSSEIKGHFNPCAWVSASQNLTDVFRSILEQTDNSTVDKESTQEELVKKLRENLENKRYLVVLDDVQTPDFLTNLLDALPEESKGCRVLLTTSNEDVARLEDPLPYQLKPLKDEDAWNLFMKKVRLPDNVEFSYVEIVELKEKIINRCKGLPLAIVVLGGSLSTKSASYQEWSKVLDHPSWQLEGNESNDVQFSKILALSYNDLPLHLRPCLLYFGLFPKEKKIPVRRLLRLWLAEGFVKQSPAMTPEDMVESYLEELVNRNMIQIKTRRKDGSPKTCLMPGALHDIFLSKAEAIGLLHTHRTILDNETAASPKISFRRVAEHGDIKEYPRKKPSYGKHLRSYLSFNIQTIDMPAKEIGSFLNEVIDRRGFGLLRVLDLEGVYKPKLPENLGKLYHLRFLGLRWTFLDTLPRSVGKLPYLETLDVKHTYISSLPKSIWKMKHLRHLCLNEIRLDMSVQKHHRSLTQLQTLWGLFVDKRSPVKNGLNGIINLRKLGLTYHLDSAQELNEWIARLASLQSLRLRSKDGSGRPSMLELKPLSSLENLTNLYLLGNLHKMPERYEFPPKLTVLTLSISKLEKDPMPILAQLPSLSVLRLLANSYTGKEMECPSEGFIALRILKLWMLEKLEKWTVEEGAMQNLQDLEIRSCHELKELPNKLLNLSNIQEIILTDMPEGFADNVQVDEHKKKIITTRKSPV
ncbi:disease resistance protein RPM1-like isoform X2 [Corylus avellana]|uniref:disease resistance protein RPM1-like isoform X2 n=1 Tax=Corylus avellana TaxID=13451 RepID=UPI00286D224F|nr:disease resistance protein RPM1-like isoform X2 [Corylus avellana]XP_059459641.1 disease resistance protein RPM1-like isoform X2 [Corylus avellana]